MEDKDIVELFWTRDPSAIVLTGEKYGNYCRAIAKRILYESRDIDECINDIHLKLWNSIPPNRPENFTAYLGKIARNAAFDKYKQHRAEKRGGGEICLVLEELGEIISADTVADTLDKQELNEAINTFLQTLPKTARGIFICRYYHALTIAEISRKFMKTQNNISVSLNRTRAKLKTYLIERGFML